MGNIGSGQWGGRGEGGREQQGVIRVVLEVYGLGGFHHVGF